MSQTIIIAGRIGKDATRNTTQNGDVVANFSVAVDTYEGREKVTNWWRCSLWGKRAEGLGPHLKKGTAVSIVGEFSLSEYEGKPQLNCRVSELTLLGGGDGQRQESRGGDGWTGEQSGGGSRSGGFADDLNDEVPFATRNSIW